MRVLIDTNILIYHQQKDHELHDKTKNAILLLDRKADELAVVPQIISEFWNVCTRPAKYGGLGLSSTATKAACERIKSVFYLYRDQPKAYDVWESLIYQYDVQGVQVHDAKLVAAMKVHGIDHILTFNTKDFKRYDGISIIHPQDL